MDTIRITGIKARGYHGTLPEETHDGQEFGVSLELEIDTRRAAETDNLEETANYADIILCTQTEITGTPVKLIETLAARIAAKILDHFAHIQALTVEVSKPSAPVPAKFENIAVRIHRRRD